MDKKEDFEFLCFSILIISVKMVTNIRLSGVYFPPIFIKLVSPMQFPSIEPSFPGHCSFLCNWKKGLFGFVLRELGPSWLDWMVESMVMGTCSWNLSRLSDQWNRKGINGTAYLLFKIFRNLQPDREHNVYFIV